MHFVDESPDTNRLKWPFNDRWAYFIGKGCQPIRLTTVPQPFDLNKTKVWLPKQVMSILKVSRKVDNYFGATDLQLMIKDAKMTDRHLNLIEQQAVGSEVPDFFEKFVECYWHRMDVTVVGSYDVITDNLFTIIISKESFIMTIKYSNRYSTEFKSSIMSLHKNGCSADFLAKKYNVSVSTVTKWMNQADPNNSKVPSDHEWALIEENQRLRE